MANSVYFNFYNNWVQVFSSNDDLLSLLKNDFLYFYVENPSLDKIFLKLEVIQSEPKTELIPQKEALRQSSSCVTYEHAGKRYNNYYDQALGVFDFYTEQGTIYSKYLNYLHEISYLLILSRVGKKMDLQGMHRLHAFGLVKNRKLILGLMPMKGGKSTLFLELCKDKDTQIISDDSPIIDSFGEVHPFPMRVGLEKLDEDKFLQYGLTDFESNVYKIQRRFYGEKKLISIKAFKNKISEGHDEIILFKAKRLNAEDCHIKQVAKIRLVIPLVMNMVIGIGLPIIIEYFWEEGLDDFFRKSKIAFKRFFAAFLLLLRSKTYKIYLGTDPAMNAEKIRTEIFGER